MLSVERNKIIKEMTKNIPYKCGDLVTPHQEKEVAIWGDDCVVENIATNLTQLGKDYVWPKDNNPLLVGVYSRKKDCRFVCTPNFLIRKEASC
jgi:hypothetical protein